MNERPQLNAELNNIEQALQDQRAGTAIAHIGAADLGRLSAEAVMASYEAAAKAVENMGEEVKTRIKRLEASLRECDEDLKLVAEAAAHIRDKGNHVQAQIDEAAHLSNEIRTVCREFSKKVGHEPGGL